MGRISFSLYAAASPKDSDLSGPTWNAAMEEQQLLGCTNHKHSSVTLQILSHSAESPSENTALSGVSESGHLTKPWLPKVTSNNCYSLHSAKNQDNPENISKEFIGSSQLGEKIFKSTGQQKNFQCGFSVLPPSLPPPFVSLHIFAGLLGSFNTLSWRR